MVRFLLRAILLAVTVTASLDAQVVLNEILASNRFTNADEDGDPSDWIEVLNTGSVRVDLEGYARWNRFTPKVVSSLEVGDPVDMRVCMLKLGGLTISQREWLRAIEPPHRLVWGMSMLGGGIVAERVQTVTALADGRSRYRTEDTIEGPLAPLAYLFTGSSVQAGFDAVAEGLEAEVMRRAKERAA